MAVKLTGDDLNKGIGFGWDSVKSNLPFFVGITFGVIVIQLIVGFILGLVNNLGLIYTLLDLISYIISFIIYIELVLIALRVVRGEVMDFATYKPSVLTWTSEYGTVLLNYFFVTVAYGIIVFVGLILLIIPGIIWGTMFSLAPILVIDKKLSFWDALQQSAQMTKGNKWLLICLALELGIINLIGAVVLLVGLLVTIPLSLLAYIYVYNHLLGENAQPSAAPMEQAAAPAPTTNIQEGLTS